MGTNPKNNKDITEDNSIQMNIHNSLPKSLFYIIKNAKKNNKRRVENYPRKIIYLITVLIFLLITSAIVINIVLDVGYNTAHYGSIINDDPNEIDSSKNHELKKEEIGYFIYFFIDRTHTYYIYLAMVMFLIIFDIQIFFRIKFLLQSLTERYFIDVFLLHNEHEEEAFKNIQSKKDITISSRFILSMVRILKTEKNKSLFPDIYSNFIGQEKRESSKFINGVISFSFLKYNFTE